MQVTHRFQLLALTVYGALFALSLVIINPWGTSRGYVWTYPKTAVVLVITLLHLGYLLFHVLEARASSSRASPKSVSASSATGDPDAAEKWWFVAGLWSLFLIIGLAACYFSPAGFVAAMRANFEMGDGWRYYALLGVFMLSNSLVLKLRPALFRVQLYGILGGGFILALAVFPQLFDRTLDYTFTNGKVSSSQMPLGFHTSRGHAGFVLAAAATLSLVGLIRSWLRSYYVWVLFFVLSVAVWATDARGVSLAYLAGLAYVGLRFAGRALSWWRTGVVVALALASFAALDGARSLFDLQPARSFPSLTSAFRDLSTGEMSQVNAAQELSSGRLEKFEIAVQAIEARPLLGWGFNGFGLSWSYFADWSRGKHQRRLASVDGERIPVQEVLSTTRGNFVYLGTDGQEHRGRGYVNKAHNIILDTAVSVGIVGLLIYVVLACYVIWVGARGPGWGLEVVAVVYIVYGLTWFESAQYSHLAWWALSAGFGLALGQATGRDEVEDARTRAAAEPA